MYYFIYLIKAVAVILISNSHLNGFYPSDALAAGGSLGNVLFFLCSGYLLKNIKQPFLKWYKKRFIRLYLPYWIFFIFYGFFVPLIFNISDLFKIYLFPTKCWFISAIACFYVGYYIIFSTKIKKYFKVLFSGFILTYLLCYILFADKTIWYVESDGYFKWLFYFPILILGGYLDEIKIKKLNQKKLVVINIVSFTFFFGIKIMFQINEFFYCFQFMTQLFSLLWGLSFFYICQKNEKHISNKKTSPLIRFTTVVANASLEIYITQGLAIKIAKQIIFPLNVLLAFVGMIFTGIVLKLIIDCIYKLLANIKTNKEKNNGK